MNFFTSDLHFGHEKIIGYCARPFSDLLDMRTELIRRWNLTVRPEDTVYVLGDFALYLRKREVAAILAELHGEKHLIRGNHDHRDNYRAAGWASVELYRQVGALHLVHNPSDIGLMTDAFGKPLVGVVLHGHLHGGKGLRERPIVHPGRKFIDVGVDVDGMDYRPISEPEILRLLHL